MKKIIQTGKQHIQPRSHSHFHSMLNKLKIQLCDVSLRDGIQTLSHRQMTTDIKKDLFHKIINHYIPSRMEVGSLSSPKIMPVMADSLYMYVYSRNTLYNKYSCFTDPPIQSMLLIPGMSQLETALQHGVDCVSFISSVSEEFQQKNTKKTLTQNKLEILDMCNYIRDSDPETYIKLYLSCINECPIKGKIEVAEIVKELEDYSRFSVDEICLSDTCGTLEYTTFKILMERVKEKGIMPSLLSLHLHVYPGKEDNVKSILYYCFQNGIHKLDVSMLESGGCSVTLGKKTSPNLSYELLYDIMEKYIEENDIL